MKKLWIIILSIGLGSAWGFLSFILIFLIGFSASRPTLGVKDIIFLWPSWIVFKFSDFLEAKYGLILISPGSIFIIPIVLLVGIIVVFVFLSSMRFLIRLFLKKNSY